MNRRHLLVGLLATSTLPVLAQSKASSGGGQPAADPLKGLAREHDKMRGITWYRHPSSPKYVNSNGFYLYFGREDGGQYTELRLVVRYFADDWLFVKSAWAKADGQTVNVPQSSSRLSGWERDNGGGDIWEWSDVPVIKPDDRAAVRTMANAKSVTVRFEGRQYYRDRNLSAQQLRAMREVISAYETSTGKPWR